jgi:hypothetical protein
VDHGKFFSLFIPFPTSFMSP